MGDVKKHMFNTDVKTIYHKDLNKEDVSFCKSYNADTATLIEIKRFNEIVDKYGVI